MMLKSIYYDAKAIIGLIKKKEKVAQNCEPSKEIHNLTVIHLEMFVVGMLHTISVGFIFWHVVFYLS